MHFLEYLHSALTDLVRHKLRTFLTMLGMIFGVGAVISMLSIGAGAQGFRIEVLDHADHWYRTIPEYPRIMILGEQWPSVHVDDVRSRCAQQLKRRADPERQVFGEP